MKYWGVMAACGVVIATNAFMLAGVARNRAGAPEARIEMTERELPLVRLGDKDTGVALRIEAASLLAGRKPVREAFIALEYRAPGLFAVDAAADARILRGRYPDRTKVIIARGLLTSRPRVHLLNPLVYVPAPYNRLLSAAGAAPRYRATLCYGANAEPWVCDLRLED